MGATLEYTVRSVAILTEPSKLEGPDNSERDWDSPLKGRASKRFSKA